MNRLISAFSALLITSIAYGQPACKCCHEKHRQFDFWVGEWIVYNPAGDVAGENTIEIVQDSCVVRENWTSSRSKFSGTSYNFFNSRSGKWQQLWIDNQGSHLELKGGLVGNQMIMTSDAIPNAKGELQIDRISWTPRTDGTVRQLWDQSVDGGKTWVVLFDGAYKRKGDNR